MKNIRYEAYRTLWQNRANSEKRIAAVKILQAPTVLGPVRESRTKT